MACQLVVVSARGLGIIVVALLLADLSSLAVAHDLPSYGEMPPGSLGLETGSAWMPDSAHQNTTHCVRAS